MQHPSLTSDRQTHVTIRRHRTIDDLLTVLDAFSCGAIPSPRHQIDWMGVREVQEVQQQQKQHCAGRHDNCTILDPFTKPEMTLWKFTVNLHLHCEFTPPKIYSKFPFQV